MFLTKDELAGIHGACDGAKLVCTECGLTRDLDNARTSAYLSRGWPKHCGYTMRLVTKAEAALAAQEGDAKHG